MEQVSPHVYIDSVTTGPATVGAIHTPKGVIMIDAPNQPTRAARWRKELESLGEIRYLINTEFHIDHTFGNAFFPGTVIAHRQTKERFWLDTVLGYCPMEDPRAHAQRVDPDGLALVEGYQAREPEITFEDRLTLELGGVTVEMFVMPGHVPKELAVHVPGDRVLFVSDNVFNGVMAWYHDSLPFEWLESLDRLKEIEADVLIPGHGPAGGKDMLDEMKAIVLEAIGRVQTAMDAGTSREEAVERISFLDQVPVSEGFKPIATKLQRLFVGRIYDQILERRA
jgi:glyoxylase-like metal-dependent hydrolase (beta-lactamase superfamily II)